MRNLTKLYLTIALFSFLSKEGFAERKDSVTVITITDPNYVPRTSSVTRLTAKPTPEPDSSRFVKKQVVKDLSEKPKYFSSLKVNKSIYGSYTDYIIDYVKSYHLNHGNRLSAIKSKNRGYFALIDNVMKRYGLPKEMKSLAIIESAMNCNAVSPVGAVGPWQFMAGTAKDLGLRVDERIDERRDFYKSTNAAARYLKYLHGIFHDWFLVIASYNCGPAPVLRAINAGNGRSFWDIKMKLPKETQNHVMAFIATTSFLDKVTNVLGLGEIPRGAKAPKADFSAFKSKSGITSDENEMDVDDDVPVVTGPKFSPEEMEKMAVLKVKGIYNIKAIAKVLDEDPVRLKRWNPTFDNEITAATLPVHLRIPIDKLEQFIIQKDKIMIESKKAN